MLELTIEDIDMRYLPFTLYVVAKELNVKKELANRLLVSMHIHIRDNETVDSKKKLPEYISRAAIRETGECCVDEFLKENLVIPSDNGYFAITSKAKELFSKSAKKQKEMIEAGFSYCGGMYICNPAMFYSNKMERP